MIEKADKGGAVVIVDIKYYIRETESQFKINDNYDRLKYDPTKTHDRLVNDTIKRFKKQKAMTDNVAEGLKTENPTTPKFYLRPKIHKRGKPGPPVVTSVNCHTSNISKYVYYHLQPTFKEIPSYVKDKKKYFIQKLNQIEEVPEDILLVTLGVRSLYTNISSSEGIKANKKVYDKHPNKTVSTKVITTFVSLILTLNNFIINSVNYILKMGCAMGTVTCL